MLVESLILRPPQEIITTLRKNACTHEINIGTNGIIFLTCNETLKKGQLCRECQNPVAIKMSKRLVDHKSPFSRVRTHEAFVLEEISQRMALLKGHWSVYRSHVLRYLTHSTHDDETILVTQMVPWSGPKNLSEFLLSGTCRPAELDSIIIEVFATLDVIQSVVPGFVHMDLLGPQIFMTQLRKNVLLPINSTRSFSLPKRKYTCVVGDFGTAVTSLHPEAIRNYGFYKHGPYVVNIFQDIFRFFLSLNSVVQPNLRAHFEKLKATIFKGQFDTFFKSIITDPNFANTGYLQLDHAVYFNYKRYSDVLKRVPSLMAYAQ
jgi:hypothetical protein